MSGKSWMRSKQWGRMFGAYMYHAIFWWVIGLRHFSSKSRMGQDGSILPPSLSFKEAGGAAVWRR